MNATVGLSQLPKPSGGSRVAVVRREMIVAISVEDYTAIATRSEIKVSVTIKASSSLLSVV